MIQIVDCVQGSEEWLRARAGRPTASKFSALLSSGRGGAESKDRKSYLYKLAGEILTGEPMDTFSNAHMERGKKMEDDARRLYTLATNYEPQQVGFIVNGDKGCSPDSLIETDGALEIKTRLAHLQIEALLKDEFISEHKAQCQGVLWVAEREWIDLIAYWPKLPPLIKRAYRDDIYIASLSRAVRDFNEELHEVVAKIRNYGSPVAGAA